MSGTAVAASAAPAGACDICGASDPLGLGTCAGCGAARADALLFLRRAHRRADRERAGAWLAEAVPGGVSGPDARDASAGLRPVVRLPAAAAGRAATALSLQGIPAFAVSRDAAWRRVPPGLVLLILACVATGVWAGITISAPMFALGPALGALLLQAAWREVRRPLWRPEPAVALGLPGRAESEVRATLAALSPGRARRLLRDLAELAAALAGGPDDAAPVGAELAAAAEELLALSCRAAVDLDQLDRALAVLDRRATSADGPGSDGARTAETDLDPARTVPDAMEVAAETRDRLAGRFEDALASLARAGSAAADPASELVRLADRFAREADVRTASWAEIRRLAG